jgi:AcrR family transcriptional regulator
MPRHRFPDTRDRIEQAALRLFVQKGVTDTTVRDIAQALGLSEGALYRHFESKDDLVWQLFEGRYVALATELQTLADAAPDTRARLAAMIRGFCRVHDEQPDLFHFLLFVQHGQLNKLRDDTPTPVIAVRRVIIQGIHTGELPQQNADLATALVFGIVLQPMQFAAYGRLPSAMTPLSDRLVAAAWAAVTAA